MYHVMKWNPRRVALQLVTKKPFSRWDTDPAPAFWNTRSAANAWAKQHIGQTESGLAGYMVLACEGADCGLGSCPNRAHYRALRAQVEAV